MFIVYADNFREAIVVYFQETEVWLILIARGTHIIFKLQSNPFFFIL